MASYVRERSPPLMASYHGEPSNHHGFQNSLRVSHGREPLLSREPVNSQEPSSVPMATNPSTISTPGLALYQQGASNYRRLSLSNIDAFIHEHSGLPESELSFLREPLPRRMVTNRGTFPIPGLASVQQEAPHSRNISNSYTHSFIREPSDLPQTELSFPREPSFPLMATNTDTVSGPGLASNQHEASNRRRLSLSNVEEFIREHSGLPESELSFLRKPSIRRDMALDQYKTSTQGIPSNQHEASYVPGLSYQTATSYLGEHSFPHEPLFPSMASNTGMVIDPHETSTLREAPYAPMNSYAPPSSYGPTNSSAPSNSYAAMNVYTPTTFYGPANSYAPMASHAPPNSYAPLHSYAQTNSYAPMASNTSLASNATDTASIGPIVQRDGPATSMAGKESVLYKHSADEIFYANLEAKRILRQNEWLLNYVLFIIYSAKTRFPIRFTSARIAVYLNTILRSEAVNLKLTASLVKELFTTCDTREGRWKLAHEQWATLWVHELSAQFKEKLHEGLYFERYVPLGGDDLRLKQKLPHIGVTL